MNAPVNTTTRRISPRERAGVRARALRQLASGSRRTLLHALRAGVLAVLVLGSFDVLARWYQVEVVAFRHDGGLSTGGETWPGLGVLPDFSDAVELDYEPQADVPEAGHRPAAFTALARNDMRLAGVARRLTNSSGYHPMLSAAWRQPSFGVRGAKRVYLSDTGGQLRAPPPTEMTVALAEPSSPQPQIDGIVSIKVAHLLHIEVDFVYDHDGELVRLSETRKAKLREIHYFDHPLFGVIVQVSPYVVPSIPETVAVGADEPLEPDNVER